MIDVIQNTPNMEIIVVLQIFKDAEIIGREIGRKKGFIEGHLEARKEIVVNMLKENMDIAQIVRATKMSKEEVEELKKKRAKSIASVAMLCYSYWPSKAAPQEL